MVLQTSGIHQPPQLAISPTKHVLGVILLTSLPMIDHLRRPSYLRELSKKLPYSGQFRTTPTLCVPLLIPPPTSFRSISVHRVLRWEYALFFAEDFLHPRLAFYKFPIALPEAPPSRSSTKPFMNQRCGNYLYNCYSPILQ